MPEFVSVCRTDDVAPGEMKLVDLGGDEVVVAHLEGAYYAFANECTHSGGPLAEGELQGTQVTCPWHFTTFDITTGRPLDGPGKDPVATYDVQIADGDVRIAPRG